MKNLGVIVMSIITLGTAVINIYLAIIILNGTSGIDSTSYWVVGPFGWAVTAIYGFFTIREIRIKMKKLMIIAIVVSFSAASCSSPRYTCEAYGKDVRQVRGEYKVQRTDKPRTIWQ